MFELASAALSIFVANYNYRKIKRGAFGLTRQLRDINFLYVPLVARIILHEFDVLLHIPSRKLTPLEANTMLNSLFSGNGERIATIQERNLLIA